METPDRPQISVTMMLALVACVAVNLWLFRVGWLWGVIALNVTKHVVIAALCQAVGVNKRPTEENAAVGGVALARVEPSSN